LRSEHRKEQHSVTTESTSQFQSQSSCFLFVFKWHIVSPFALHYSSSAAEEVTRFVQYPKVQCRVPNIHRRTLYWDTCIRFTQVNYQLHFSRSSFRNW